MPNYQIIEIATPTEQEKIVQYGDRAIRFKIRWNEKTAQWFLDLYEENVPLLNGITMVTNSNLLYDDLGLGKLYLVDTKYGLTTEPVTKSDLGSRLVLMRDFEE